MLNGLMTAIRTLTVIPVPGKGGNDFSSDLPWFPVAGLLIGAGLYVVTFLWAALLSEKWTWGCAVIVTVLEIWLTRGLHMDGLADWADSLGGFSRERRLAIMKDSSLGAFGVMALVLIIIIKLVVFERIIASAIFMYFIIIPVISRSMLVELQTTMPYARGEQGMAVVFIKNAANRHRIISHGVSLAACLCFGVTGVALFILALAVTLFLKGMFRRQFNGVTGDLLGASNEIIEAVLLMSVAIPGKMIF
ncbi:MAG: adenosylcobinamide-GDP ribazoletransferase [Deltaproteobacteria bacterium]|nr:adenosylcobinamide-GDP ribazoletransferase [Deltaproteobacteria bacterium]